MRKTPSAKDLLTAAASGKGAERFSAFLHAVSTKGTFPGVTAVASINFLTNPAEGDILNIGLDSYVFAPSGAQVAGGIPVEIGGDTGETLSNIIAAINGTASNPHATIADTSGDPLPGVGHESIFAETPSPETLAIMPATLPGGDIFPSNPDTALSAVMANTSIDWTTQNMNLIGGALSGDLSVSGVAFRVTSEHISRGSLSFRLPVSPKGMILQARRADGSFRFDFADRLIVNGKYIVLVFGGSGADLLAGEDVSILYW